MQSGEVLDHGVWDRVGVIAEVVVDEGQLERDPKEVGVNRREVRIGVRGWNGDLNGSESRGSKDDVNEKSREPGKDAAGMAGEHGGGGGGGSKQRKQKQLGACVQNVGLREVVRLDTIWASRYETERVVLPARRRQAPFRCRLRHMDQGSEHDCAVLSGGDTHCSP